MAELHVSKKNISKLLSEMQGKKFIIPDFQRPYKWNVEKCETLWNDIQNFLETDAESGSDYFLGTVVSYKNEKEIDIIDGQQRITSFFLLLRSFYKKLESMTPDEDVIGLKAQIAPCIWDINPISQKVTDFSKIHIESKVATEEDKEVFHNILKTGDYSEKATDNYSKNYHFFKIKNDEYAKENPMNWKNLCVTILQRCIILPIDCDTPETALTIFSTLNDRGLPLADSDIFKAQLYSNDKTEKGKKEFIEQWKELTDICKAASITIDDVFRYYTHVLRAKNGDKSKEIGLRKFYAGDKEHKTENYAQLKQADFMTQIMDLANFWQYVKDGEKPKNDKDEEVNYTISLEAQKYLHCLNYYPNEFWKYATSVFFITNKDNENFEESFAPFLKKLMASLLVKFIVTPSVNAIKDDTYNACIAVSQGKDIQFRLDPNKEHSMDNIKAKIREHASSRISRPLLLLDAYLHPNQKDILPTKFDIEHIFPKKWQEANYNGWLDKEAQQYLDRFGNKIVFEKKLNIQAGNGYFGVKKLHYSRSKFSVIQELSQYPKNDWVKEDIEAREAAFIERLTDFFENEIAVLEKTIEETLEMA